MNNIGTIINTHNKKILNNNPSTKPGCNYIEKYQCPLPNKCSIPNVVYKATITSTLSDYKPKTYIGISEPKFKLRYANYKKAFNHERFLDDAELSKEFWKIKEISGNPQVSFEVLKRCPPTRLICV